MILFRWVLGSVAAIVATWILTLNWMMFWRGWVRREKTSSIIPLVGAMAGAIALLVLPVPSLRYLSWIPFLVDWGSLPVLVIAMKKHYAGR